jgi:hypothetical protein
MEPPWRRILASVEMRRAIEKAMQEYVKTAHGSHMLGSNVSIKMNSGVLTIKAPEHNLVFEIKVITVKVPALTKEDADAASGALPQERDASAKAGT